MEDKYENMLKFIIDNNNSIKSDFKSFEEKFQKRTIDNDNLIKSEFNSLEEKFQKRQFN